MQNVKKIEDRYTKTDGIIDEEVDHIIISLGDANSNEETVVNLISME